MRVVTIAVLMLALMACDEPEVSRPHATANIDPDDPCELLTSEQVERAVQRKVSSEQEVDSHDPGTRICSYKTAPPWTSVAISLRSDFTSADWAREKKRDPINAEPVSGIGKGAFIHGCAAIAIYESDVHVWASVQHLTTCEETGFVLKRLGRIIATTITEAKGSLSST